MTPKYMPRVIRVPSVGDSIEIVMHVSNFYSGKGGISESILFGDYESLLQREMRLKLLSMNWMENGAINTQW